MNATADNPDLLADSARLVEGLQETMKYAKQLEGENASLQEEVRTLKVAASEKEPAIIQKVASVGEDQLDYTLNFLVERELLDPADVEKLASSIREDPNVALRLAEQVAAITSQPVVSDRGRGISKSAGRADVEKGASAPAEAGGFGSASGWLVV